MVGGQGPVPGTGERVDQGLRLRVEHLWASGVPSSHIARRLDMTRSEVNHVIKDYVRRRGWLGK